MISLGRFAIRSTVVMLALLTLVAAGVATVTAKSAMAAGTLTNTTGNTVTAQPPSPTIMGKVGVPLSVQLLATDSDPSQTLTWSATGLPAGLTISPSGVLSGTPTAAGAFIPTATVTDGTGARGSATFPISISPASTVTVTDPGAQTDVVDVTVQLQMVATDSDPTQALTWSATGLPAGLTISPSSGLISGFPRTVAPNTASVTATDGNGATDTVSFPFTISCCENNVDVAVPAGVQSGVVGSATSLQLSATDSAPGQTLTWSATKLPPGLSISTTSGLISGTPTANGTFVTTASATDTTGASGSALIIWQIASNPRQTVTNPGPQTGTVGTAVSLQLAETGFQAPAWSATELPPGLTINSSTGLISGTPTTAGTFSVTAAVTDSTGVTASVNFLFTINPAGTCHITYTRNSEWPGGWTAQVVINNTGTTTINGWSLTFTFPGDQKVTSNFNGGFSQTGENATLTNASYNGTIAPGASITDGFMGTWTSNDTNPASFAVNGATCT